MAGPESEHIYGVQLRESADDGSDFSNADSDYRILFLGEDGFLHVKDSAGSVTDAYENDGGGGGGNPVVYDREVYTGGDISVTSTSAGDDIANPPDLVVAAAAGDVLMIGVSARRNDTDTDSLRMDVKFITGATENYASSGSTSPASTGVAMWFMGASGTGSHVHSVGGEYLYVVQAADISGGNVTLSLRAWVSATGPVLAAQAAAPLVFWVRNLGQ